MCRHPMQYEQACIHVCFGVYILLFRAVHGCPCEHGKRGNLLQVDPCSYSDIDNLSQNCILVNVCCPDPCHFWSISGTLGVKTNCCSFFKHIWDALHEFHSASTESKPQGEITVRVHQDNLREVVTIKTDLPNAIHSITYFTKPHISKHLFHINTGVQTAGYSPYCVLTGYLQLVS